MFSRCFGTREDYEVVGKVLMRYDNSITEGRGLRERLPLSERCPVNAYWTTGFTTLQYAVDQAWLEEVDFIAYYNIIELN